MPDPHIDNRRHLIRMWGPALLFCSLVGLVLVLALTSGDRIRTLSAVIGIALTALLVMFTRWRQRRRFARLLQSPDPSRLLRLFATGMSRVPHGPVFAAGISATVLALYGRFEEAEHTLESLSLEGVPPLIQAQASAARAILAYARGSLNDGLDHAVAATQQSSVDSTVPGAQRSDLAFRTYRNLGLALSGRATETTTQELRAALEQLPLLGQILAAWGLAAIAQRNGDPVDYAAMRAFIEKRAPHLTAVLGALPRSVSG